MLFIGPTIFTNHYLFNVRSNITQNLYTIPTTLMPTKPTKAILNIQFFICPLNN